MTNGLRADIRTAHDKMHTKLGSEHEVEKLPDYLREGERVHAMVGGNYGPRVRPYPPGRSLLVLTDRRLLFMRASTGVRFMEDFPLEKVTSVEWLPRGLAGHVVIFRDGDKAEIKHVDKNDGKLIVDLVSRIVNFGRST